MSTWIFKAAVVGLVVVVAGCGGRFDAVAPAKPATPVATTAAGGQKTIAVSDRSVVVAGPAGFCVDSTASRPTDAQPFVLMGNCAAITGDQKAPQPGIKAVLTASVIPTANPNIPSDQMNAFLQSDAGRQALSRADDPSTVSILESFEKDGIHYVHTRDTSEGVIDDLATDYWRAYFGVNDQLISTAVLGFRDGAVSSEKGLETLQQFSNLIRSESPSKGTRAPVTAVVQDPVEPVSVEPAPSVNDTPATPRDEKGLRRIGLFRRILG